MVGKINYIKSSLSKLTNLKYIGDIEHLCQIPAKRKCSICDFPWFKVEDLVSNYKITKKKDESTL